MQEIPALADASFRDADSFELADINFDGFVDVVRSFDRETRVFFGKGETDSTFNEEFSWQLDGTTIHPDLRSVNNHFVDMNGDTYTDVLVFAGQTKSQGTVYLYDPKTKTHSVQESFAIPGDSNAPIETQITANRFIDGRARFIDLNGDGLTDVLTTMPYGDAVVWLYCYNSASIDPFRLGVGKNFFRCRMAPLPTPQIAAGNSWVLSRKDILVQDFNGDQLPDLAYAPASPAASRVLCVYFNNGNIYQNGLIFGEQDRQDPSCGSGRRMTFEGLDSKQNLFYLWKIDVNGDGLTDFAEYDREGSSIKVWINLGDGQWTRQPRRIPLPGLLYFAHGPNMNAKVADFDADGQQEILILGTNPQDQRTNALIIDFNRSRGQNLVKANLLISARIETGQRYDIQYATSLDEQLRDQRLDIEANPLHFPITVVKRVIESASPSPKQIESPEILEYAYQNPSYDTIDRGFQGFARVITLRYGDVNLEGSVQIDDYYQEKTFPERLRAGTLASKATYRLTDETIGDPSLWKLTQSTITLNELDDFSLGQYTREIAEVPCSSDPSCHLVQRQMMTSTLRPSSFRNVYLILPERDVIERFDSSKGICLKSPTAADGADLLSTQRSFDEYGYLTEERVKESAVTSPHSGARIPSSSKRIVINYEDARGSLADFGILSSPGLIETFSRYDSDPFMLYSREVLDHDEMSPWLKTRTTSRLRDRLEGLPPIYQTRYVHDLFGNLREQYQDRLGKEELEGAMDYGPDGLFPRRSTNRLGQTTSLEYNEWGDLSVLVDQRKLTTWIDYDGLNRTELIRNSSGQRTRIEYKQGYGYSATQQKFTIHRSEETSPYVYLKLYDTFGQELAVVEQHEERGVRFQSFKEYGRNKQVLKQWDAFREPQLSLDGIFQGGLSLSQAAIWQRKKVATLYQYDGLGRVVEMKYPDGETVTMGYPVWGVLKSYDRGQESRNKCESTVVRNDKVWAKIDALGQITRFDYDGRGRMKAILLPEEKEARSMLISGEGLVESQVIPGIASFKNSYDGRDRLAKVEKFDKDGRNAGTLRMVYDAGDRLLQRYQNESLLEENGYDQYDSATWKKIQAIQRDLSPNVQGLKTFEKRIDPLKIYDYLKVFGYTSRGQVALEYIEIGSKTYWKKTFYNDAGEPIREENSFGLSMLITRSANSNLKELSFYTGPSEREVSLLSDLDFHESGQMESVIFPGQLRIKMGFDPLTNRLASIRSQWDDTQKVLQDLSYIYEPGGNLQSIRDALPDGSDHKNVSSQYRYNKRDELIAVTSNERSLNYDYSPSGNLILNHEAQATPLEPWSSLLTTAIIPNVPAPKSTEEQPYRFNAEGQLEQGGLIVQTHFDPSGRLLCAVTRTSVVFFGYDSGLRRIYRRSAPHLLDATALEARVESEKGLNLCLSFQDLAYEDSFTPAPDMYEKGAKQESFLMMGETRLAVVDHNSKEWAFFLRDHLGSTTGLIRADGTMEEILSYDPYGHETELKNQGSDQVRFRFTQEERDQVLGLYFFGARYYDTLLSRFISPDPLYVFEPQACLRSALECNLYSYARNNPIKYLDPTGLETVQKKIATVDASLPYRIRESIGIDRYLLGGYAPGRSRAEISIFIDNGNGKNTFIDNEKSPAVLMTGQKNNAQNQVDAAKDLSKKLGRPVYLIQNESEGIIEDCRQTLLVKIGLNSAPVQGLKALLTGEISHHKLLPKHIVAHSQGTTYTTEAISELNRRLQSSLWVTYYGNASYAQPEAFAYFKNVVNPQDFVPMFFGISSQNVVPADIGFGTHGLQTYMQAVPPF